MLDQLNPEEKSRKIYTQNLVSQELFPSAKFR